MTGKILGLVLAGGRSSRFGSEKALADVNGRPIIAHVAAILARGCDRVAINARPQSLSAAFAEAEGMTCLTDAPGDPDGPLAGVKAGLIWAKASGADLLATAPCDTPFLPDDMVEKLRLACDGGKAVVSTTVEGLQPLCTLWPVDALEHISAALKNGQHPSIKDILYDFGAVTVLFDDPADFANLNTLNEYQSAVTQRSFT